MQDYNKKLPIPKNKLILSALIALLLLLMTVTVYTPSLIYFLQREFFEDDFLKLIRLPFLSGLVGVLILVALLAILPRAILKYITSLLILFSFLVWFQADYFSVSYGALDGAALDFNHFDSRGDIEIGVLVVAFFLGIIFSNFIIKNGGFVMLMVLIGQFALVTFNVVQEPKVKEKTVSVDEEFHNYSSEKNIVLIVLDTFGAEYFQRLIKMKTGLVESYPGFVSYTDAISNYPATRGSMTSLLMGKMLPTDVQFKPYKKANLPKFGLPMLFHENNYEVSVISNSNWLNDSYRKRFMSKITIDQNVMTEYYSTQLFDYALFRASAHYLKPHVFNEGRWLFSEQVSNQAQIPNTPTEKGRMLLDSLVTGFTVNDSRPRFKMIHLTMPHPEYVYDRQCKKNEELDFWPVERRMLEQSECALTRLNLLLEKFKSNGIYDKSLIVVTSDHGSRILNKHDVTGFPSQFEMNSSGILMMIKGIGQTAPFHQVDQPVSLIKLAPALLDDSLHNTDYSTLRDDNRLFYAYQNWHGGAEKSLPDAPLYQVAANYEDRKSWQLIDFGVNQCVGQTLPVAMTFETAEREGYCSVFGLARPSPKGGGTWTDSDDIRIIFNLEQNSLNSAENQVFQAEFEPMLFNGQKKLDLKVFVNDHLIGQKTITEKSRQVVEFEFPNSILKSEKNVIKLLIPEVTSMKKVGAGYNIKKLGLFISAINIRDK